MLSRRCQVNQEIVLLLFLDYQYFHSQQKGWFKKMKNKIKNHKISYLYQNNKYVPFIKLTGKWLEENGFNIGDKVKISLSKGMLLLVKED